MIKRMAPPPQLDPASEPPPSLDPDLPQRIDGRHRVLGEIGRGGMARVYRVVDEVTGRELALKRLHKGDDEKRYRQSAELFEREYRTLAQLSHPRVIEVYGYGVSEAGPYYTMELLDGGDLRERSPLPWREACELIFDVCSSLALLHSRRLVHRDISPRNVRCTQTGRAKLIDFGAMVPMGPCAQVVGTPAFIAPEVVHRSALDGRTDIYSLGATLYYALTGRMPYPARDLSGVLRAWSSPAAPPSVFAADIPAELDALVTSMINLEPALRPRSAFEVMQRLLALAGLARDEPSSVSQAYLATPVMVGRDQALSVFRRQMERALRSRGGGLLISAEAGLGRSRLLDACALEAKLLGAVTLHVSAGSEQGEPLAAARELCEQLIDVLPELALSAAREIGAIGTLFEEQHDRSAPDGLAAGPPARLELRRIDGTPAAQLQLHAALVQWFVRVSRRQALLLAIDDVDRVDDGSIGLLAALAHRSRRQRLLLAMTAEAGRGAAAGALDVLATHCVELALRPLDRDQTETLLGSVFGDVPNLSLLAERIHAVAAGRPRECMALARHLVERGAIAYAGGSWTLPGQLSAADLPLRADDVFQARIAALQPRALRLARLHAFSVFQALARSDYAQLDPQASAEQLDAAIGELQSHEMLYGDGLRYTLSHRALRVALQDGVAESEAREYHRALAELYERSDRPAIAAAKHWLDAGVPERALDRLGETLHLSVDRADLLNRARLSYAELGALLERALDAAERLPRSAREVFELRRWLLGMSVVCEDRLHHRAGPALVAQLVRDSGLGFFREQDEPDPMQRLTRALHRAGEQYAQTPEAERVYRVDEAIKHLVFYVVMSIAIGARTFDARLIASLPPLLEPFAPLSPVLHAMWQNALATVEINRRQYEQARARWLQVFERLDGISGAELEHADAIRNAVAYAIGTVELLLGMQSVGRWAALLDKDPLHQVNAMYLRKALCLQRGDFDNAERFRRKAELLAVQATTRQMFTSNVVTELIIHATARDLIGVRQIMDRIPLFAAEHEGWRPYRPLAEAYFLRLSGDLGAARAAFARAVGLSEPDPADPDKPIVAWPSAIAGYIETLVDLGEHHAARDLGERALATCAKLEIGLGAVDLERALALAEGKAGDLSRAAARLDAIIAAQRALAVVGLNLGTSYEARARIAIWAGDRAGVDMYGRLCANEYRHGRDSPLGTRYERLMQEARRAGMHALPQLASFDTAPIGTTTLGGARATETIVTEALKGADGVNARTSMALSLLCEAHAASGGHLYVMGESGLGLAASFAADPPDDRLEPFLINFWQQHLLEPDMPTAFVPEGGPAAVSTASLWTDSRGTLYQPVLISCMVDGATMHVGIAVLIPGEAPERKLNAPEITTTIATYLLRSGDARGVPG
jgi:serine/threonine-protein kinase